MDHQSLGAAGQQHRRHAAMAMDELMFRQNLIVLRSEIKASE
jgi:hypothetical protein